MVRIRLGFLLLTMFLSDASAYQCVYCPTGKYKSEIANNACWPCPVNTYNALTGKDDVNACLACTGNTMTATSYGGVVATDCICKPGFYGPPGGPCVKCAAGTYQDEMGQSACKACPDTNSISPEQSTASTDCKCVAGYTGPNGGTCEMCAEHTYKTAIGPQACTACVANTMTLGFGKTAESACVCTPGYTAGSGAAVMPTYSSTACARLLTLTSKPSFATMSTRNNIGVGSAILPTYNAVGGPNGGGSVVFNGLSFFNAPRTFNVLTNGGVTLIMVVRFSAIGANRETIFTANSANNYFSVMRGESTDLVVLVSNGQEDIATFTSATGVVTLTNWIRIAITYDTTQNQLSVSINDAAPNTVQANDPGSFLWSSPYLADETFQWVMVGSTPDFPDRGFTGDMAGFLFVDEVLSGSAITAIKNTMMQGVDLTTLCEASVGGCTGCSAGKYKVAPGPAACTNCGVQTYSTVVAASSAATCESCPENTVSLIGSGVITACTCNTGYTGQDGHACTACLAGQYKDVNGSAVCTDCGLGKYSALTPAKTAATCQACPANSYTLLPGKVLLSDCQCNAGYTGSNGDCVACVAGKYKITSGSALCSSCLPDTYSTVVASTSGATCLACPASSQSPEGSGAKAACVCNMGYTGVGGSAPPYTCTACLAGTFKDATGPAACTNCAADTYSTALAAVSVTTCEGCASNMQSSPGSNEAIDCKCNKGYTGGDGTTCAACGAGTFKISVGSALCENCPADKYSTAIAKTDSVCDSCLASSQSLAGSVQQTDCKCNAGYSGLDGDTCTACGSGQYKPEVGAAVCSNCPENHYQPDAAKTALSDCKTCGPNSLSSVANALQASCQCAPGYTGPNGGTCEACYMGTFKRNKGAHECTLCPNATYSGETAQTSDTTCQACPTFSRSWMGSTARSDCHCEFGYYTNNIGMADSSCTKCAVGTFNDRLNQEACSKCPAGKFSNVETATSEETCQICTVGFSVDGQSQCDACPGNSTAPHESDNIVDCLCNPGYTGANGGTCTHCMPGKFKGDEGSALCTNCLPDTYHSEYAKEFQSDCNNCDPNAEAPAGSDSRDDCKCKVGWTSNIPDRDGEACVACKAGKFKDEIGYFACEDCEANTYVSTEASHSSTQCQRCFPDSKSPAGSDSLEDCLCIGGFERV